MSFIDRITIQKIGLALSIIIVLNMFFNYGVYSFYPSPKFEDFCPTDLTRTAYGTKDSCEEVGGVWITTISQSMNAEEPRSVPIKVADDAAFKPYCDATATCRDEFKDAQGIYNRNVFIALVILGALAVVGAFMATSVSAVSSGLLFGGLLSFFIGTVRFWSDMNDYLRFIILGIVLIVLIVVGYKKLADRQDRETV